MNFQTAYQAVLNPCVIDGSFSIRIPEDKWGAVSVERIWGSIYYNIDAK
jgi:hypothetical protein